MAEASSTYPVPPAFYTLYDRKSAVAPPVPPKPVEGTYAVFGISTSSQPALPSLQGQALFETAADGSIGVSLCSPCHSLAVGRSIPSSLSSGKLVTGLQRFCV